MTLLQNILISSIIAYFSCECFAQSAHQQEEESKILMAISSSFFSPLTIDTLFKQYGIDSSGSFLNKVSVPRVQTEKLSFSVDWNFVNAGGATMITYSFPSRQTLGVDLFGYSNGAISALYKVRDGMRCEMKVEGLVPIFFEEHIRENRYRADRFIFFNQVHNKAYTNRQDTGMVIPEKTHSLLSLFSYLRTKNLFVSDSFRISCVVQKKLYNVMFVCVKKEIVKVPAGTFSCFCVEPKLMDAGRVFSSRDKISIWISDDQKKIPVMIRSKLAFGSLYIRLTSGS